MQLLLGDVGVFRCFLGGLFVFSEVADGEGGEVEGVGAEGGLEDVEEGDECRCHIW